MTIISGEERAEVGMREQAIAWIKAHSEKHGDAADLMRRAKASKPSWYKFLQGKDVRSDTLLEWLENLGFKMVAPGAAGKEDTLRVKYAADLVRIEELEFLLDASAEETRANFSALYHAATEIIPDLKKQIADAEARAEKAERERDAALEQNAAKIQAATVEILNGFTNAVAGTDGKKHFSVGITCPYCGFRSSSIEGAEAHDGQCEKHPGVMRAVKAERERNVLAREIMRRGEQSDYDLCPYDGSAKCLYPDSIPCHRSTDGVKECWLKWAEQQAAAGVRIAD